MRIHRFAITLAIVAATAGTAAAQVTIERAASILVFPKIIANGTRDTIVQITNTSNSMVGAHCFYVNAALTDPTRPQGPLNPPLWQEIDFSIQLTRQQPTQWRVSRGRTVNPGDPPCGTALQDCPDAGFDPGRVPPVVPDFVGELKCVEVDGSGAPVSGNHLLGAAMLFDRERSFGPEETLIPSGASKYNAIGIRGDENNGDSRLILGGGQCAQNGAICSHDGDCGGDGPCAREYDACPQSWIVNHLAHGAPNLVLDDTFVTENRDSSYVETSLTIVPCTQDYENQDPTRVTLQFQTWNEYESQFSVSTSVTCWGDFTFGDLGSPVLTFAGTGLPDPQGTMYMQTRIRSAGGTPFGVIMVAEELHASRPSNSSEPEFRIATRAAANVHFEGERPVPDVITIPDDQLQP